MGMLLVEEKQPTTTDSITLSELMDKNYNVIRDFLEKIRIKLIKVNMDKKHNISANKSFVAS
jgi:hypothetical protein